MEDLIETNHGLDAKAAQKISHQRKWCLHPRLEMAQSKSICILRLVTPVIERYSGKGLRRRHPQSFQDRT